MDGTQMVAIGFCSCGILCTIKRGTWLAWESRERRLERVIIKLDIDRVTILDFTDAYEVKMERNVCWY